MSATLVRDIMTESPVTCTVNTDIGKVAKLMAQHDCGAIPVVETRPPQQPRGIVTDRDIVLRTVAEDIDPLKMKVADVMTNTALTVAEDDPVEKCLRVMQDRQVRRVIVVDEDNACCGIVALADIARHLEPLRSGEVVQRVSRPNAQASVPTP